MNLTKGVIYLKIRRKVKHYRMYMQSMTWKYGGYPDFEWEFYRKVQKSWKYQTKRKRQYKGEK